MSMREELMKKSLDELMEMFEQNMEKSKFLFPMIPVKNKYKSFKTEENE